MGSSYNIIIIIIIELLHRKDLVGMVANFFILVSMHPANFTHIGPCQLGDQVPHDMHALYIN